MKLRNKKTGKIVELDHFSVHYNRPEEWGQQPCSTWCHSLAELNEEWEDYEPKEPLIKDEKIRKAVRAWAEANDYGNDEVYEFEDFWTSWRSWSLEHRGDDNEIHFNGGIDFDKMNHRGTYTIAELCGEEEE